MTLVKIISADPSGVERVGLAQAGRYPIPTTRHPRLNTLLPATQYSIPYTHYPHSPFSGHKLGALAVAMA